MAQPTLITVPYDVPVTFTLTVPPSHKILFEPTTTPGVAAQLLSTLNATQPVTLLAVPAPQTATYTSTISVGQVVTFSTTGQSAPTATLESTVLDGKLTLVLFKAQADPLVTLTSGIPANDTRTETSGSTPIVSTTSTAPGSPQNVSGTANPNANRLPGGAVAGVALGCLVAGAVLALIGVFILLRRKKGPAIRGIESHLPQKTVSPSNLTVISSAKKSEKNNQSYLPQPVEDEFIIREVSKLQSDVKNHVQTYYALDGNRPNLDRERLRDMGTALNLSTNALGKLLGNPSTRSDALRSYIAWTILSHRRGGLAHDLDSMINRMQPEAGGQKPEFFSKWKVLTGVLLPENDNQNRADNGNAGDGESHLFERLHVILQHFVRQGGDEEKRQRNLGLVTNRASKLAFLLFSQPGSFEFRFSNGTNTDMAVFPALVQVLDDDARSLNPPRTLCRMEVMYRKEA